MKNNRTIYSFASGVIVGVILFRFLAAEPTSIVSDAVKHPSRVWLELAEMIVKTDKPTPPESARLYAYVATAYSEALRATQGDETQSSQVTRDIFLALKPNHETLINELHATDISLSSEATEVRASLLKRMDEDGFKNKSEITLPVGDGKWKGVDPFAPDAPSWKRWIIETDDDIVAPPPPKWGSSEHQAGLMAVKTAAKNRTVEQSAAVNFWGGVPGTQAPAGIWQDRLYDETKDQKLTNEQYAFAQMVLAQALADSFIECWEEKYTYWTARPSMDDPEILQYQAMADPQFPSYTSGHSTISSTAATILGVLFPQKSATWNHDAEEARDSRLWGGIHFPYDNEEGFALGEKLGQAVVERLDLQPIVKN